MDINQYIGNIVNEELNRSDVKAIVNDKLMAFLDDKDFQSKIKDIVADAFENFYKMMYNKRGFWKGDLKR